ncbi:MAG TPA: hypothetical protein PKC76_06600 [Saprospiraceae bacterium]|nr:hypothetical protein [Saprospiraceae bacterium]HMP23781.1 hypothetical protein [Saprospiraceae bacterium]
MRIITLVFALFFTLNLSAQSYAFGIKGGLTVGFQRWDESFQRDALYRYHGIAFIESAPEGNEFAVFAQAGYHVKGSAIRTFRTTVETPTGFVAVPSQTIPFEFRNASLTLGGKKKYDLGVASKMYYLLGVRGDYTVSTKLRPDFVSEENPYAILFPFDGFVNKFNYGITLGGGLEFPFSEYIAGVIEFTVNPDFSRQYNQPEIPNVINPNPNFGSSRITIRERQIVNTTFEVTLGLRFLHKIVYID